MCLRWSKDECVTCYFVSLSDSGAVSDSRNLTINRIICVFLQFWEIWMTALPVGVRCLQEFKIQNELSKAIIWISLLACKQTECWVPKLRLASYSIAWETWFDWGIKIQHCCSLNWSGSVSHWALLNKLTLENKAVTLLAFRGPAAENSEEREH